MNKKRCPGVHRYTTPQKAGTAKSKHSTARFGGATIKDGRIHGTGPKYSGGIMIDRRESSRGGGTGAWTKKNKNKDKHKAKSGIIPHNLKKPPAAKHKKAVAKKVTKDKFNE